MKKIVLPGILGAAAFVLRWLLYAFYEDETLMLTSGTLLESAVWLLTLGAVVYILAFVWKLDGSAVYEDNFGPSQSAMVGCFLMAAGMLLTMLSAEPRMSGYLGNAWLVLGWLSPVCFLLAGLARARGTKPFFLLHLIPCLFFVFHLVNHYQMWSGNPQLQDYFFPLFGTVALMLFAYHCAAFGVEAGSRRAQLFMGLAAAYLLATDLGHTLYPWMDLGGIAWAMTDLCSLTPKPKPEPEKPQEEET